MKKLLLLALLAAAALPARAAILQLDLQGSARPFMSGLNENPSNLSLGNGNEVGGGITYDDVLNLLTINVQWFSLTGSVTAAHIHATASTGAAVFTTNGGVIFGIDGSTPGFSNAANGGGWTNTQVTLSGVQETQLLANQLYLNAHTSGNPGGEIRANLVQAVPEPGSAALLLAGCLGLLVRRRR